MAHAALDRLAGHEQIGLGLLPHPVQLLLRGAILSQPAHHIPQGVQGPPPPAPAHRGVHPQKTGVPVVGVKGVHRVAQPLLLPQLLEQPGGAAPLPAGR